MNKQNQFVNEKIYIIFQTTTLDFIRDHPHIVECGMRMHH